MKKINLEIRDRYEKYCSLLNEEKLLSTNPIIVDKKVNNPFWVLGQAPIFHPVLPDNISLIIEASNRENKYGIKLQCRDLSCEPFFRFDSAGATHRNNSPDIPLSSQQITTPHFNTFDKEGRSIAYKNDALLNEGNANAIESDIEFGLSLFCQEANTILKDGSNPNIQSKNPEIELGFSKLTNYDKINFE